MMFYRDEHQLIINTKKWFLISLKITIIREKDIYDEV